MRGIPGATSAQAVCIQQPQAAQFQRRPRQCRVHFCHQYKSFKLVLGASSSARKPRRATRDKNDLSVLLRQQPRRSSKRSYPQKQRHTHARSGDSLRPSGRLPRITRTVSDRRGIDAEQTRPRTRYKHTHQSPDQLLRLRRARACPSDLLRGP